MHGSELLCRAQRRVDFHDSRLNPAQTAEHLVPQAPLLLPHSPATAMVPLPRRHDSAKSFFHNTSKLVTRKSEAGAQTSCVFRWPQLHHMQSQASQFTAPNTSEQTFGMLSVVLQSASVSVPCTASDHRHAVDHPCQRLRNSFCYRCNAIRHAIALIYCA